MSTTTTCCQTLKILCATGDAILITPRQPLAQLVCDNARLDR